MNMLTLLSSVSRQLSTPSDELLIKSGRITGIYEILGRNINKITITYEIKVISNSLILLFYFMHLGAFQRSSSAAVKAMCSRI